MVPRTLVLTDEHLLLCDEDYGHWPQLAVSTCVYYDLRFIFRIHDH